MVERRHGAVGDPVPKFHSCQLGLSAGASFEQVQSAGSAASRTLTTIPRPGQSEAAYDAVLMARLRDANKSAESAAATSQREDGQQLLRRRSAAVRSCNRSAAVFDRAGLSGLAPQWSLVEGQDCRATGLRWLGLVLLFVSPGSVQLILALAVIGCFLSQIRRGRRPLASLGWTLLLLVAGLVSGVVLVSALSPSALAQLQLSGDQIQAIPAALLLLMASLLLA